MRTKTAAKLAAIEEGGRLPISYGALGRVFDPPLTRQAVHLWGETVPAERVTQLRTLRPAWFVRQHFAKAGPKKLLTQR